MKELLDNPPLLASLVAIVMILIPGFRTVLLTQGTFCNRALFNSLEQVGNMSPPIILLFLGFTLYFCDFRNSKLPRKSLTGITVVKLLINPLVGSIILAIFWQLSLIRDPVLLFVSYLSFGTPCAINVLIIANLYSDKAQEISFILIWQYLLSIVTIPILMIAFFSIVLWYYEVRGQITWSKFLLLNLLFWRRYKRCKLELPAQW